MAAVGDTPGVPDRDGLSLLADFHVIIEARVAWGEMDAFAHVNNAVYFRWFESARIAYLERIDFTGGAAHAGVGPILHSTHCRFRRPLAYPDVVRVGARTVELADDPTVGPGVPLSPVAVVEERTLGEAVQAFMERRKPEFKGE